MGGSREYDYDDEDDYVDGEDDNVDGGDNEDKYIEESPFPSPHTPIPGLLLCGSGNIIFIFIIIIITIIINIIMILIIVCITFYLQIIPFGQIIQIIIMNLNIIMIKSD